MTRIGNFKTLECHLLRKRRKALNNPAANKVNVITFAPIGVGEAPGMNTLISIVDNLESGTLTLLVENPRVLSVPQFDALVDFCTDFMGQGPSCSYELTSTHQRVEETEVEEVEGEEKGELKTSTISATVITWCNPLVEDAHLRVVVNSDGIVGEGYNNLKIFNDHKKAEYYDCELRAQISEKVAVRKQ